VVYGNLAADGGDQVVAEQLAVLQAIGHANIGVFARTNARTAHLSAALTGLGSSTC